MCMGKDLQHWRNPYHIEQIPTEKRHALKVCGNWSQKTSTLQASNQDFSREVYLGRDSCPQLRLEDGRQLAGTGHQDLKVSWLTCKAPGASSWFEQDPSEQNPQEEQAVYRSEACLISCVRILQILVWSFLTCRRTILFLMQTCFPAGIKADQIRPTERNSVAIRDAYTP